MTIYRRGDEARIPNVWELRSGNLCVTCHRLNGVPDEWFVSCHDVCIDRWSLQSKDVEAAKVEAIDIVRRKLRRLLAELDAAAPEATDDKPKPKGA